MSIEEMPRSHGHNRIVMSTSRRATHGHQMTNRGGRRLVASAIQGIGYAVKHRRAIYATGQAIRQKASNYFKKRPVSKLVDRDKIQEDLGTGGELTKNSANFSLSGKMSTLKMTEKLVAANKQSALYRFSGIQPFMNISSSNYNFGQSSVSTPGGTAALLVGGGYFPLFNTENSSNVTIPSTWKVAPLHVYDITSINNYVNGSVTSYTAGWGVSFNLNNVGLAPTSVNFTALYGLNSNNSATSAYWQNENTPGGGSFNSPLRRDMLDYVSAKMLCYGSAKAATEFKIELIQLKDDFLHPDYYTQGAAAGNTSNAVSGQYAQEALSFWQSYASKSVKHPIASLDTTMHKHYKVLKTLCFTLQPRLSTETDAAVGHCKQINLFSRLNRICKYDWLQVGLDPSEDKVSTYISNVASVQNVVAPRARIYMTIQALNTTQNVINTGTLIAGSVDYTPSYDLVLRTKHTLIE